MAFRVWAEKARMILFIRGLEKKTISRTIYEEQKFNKWPGLSEETAKICQNLGIEYVNLTNMEHGKYMNVFLEACHKSNEEKLRSLATGKCLRINEEVYQKKDYILYKNIYTARQTPLSQPSILHPPKLLPWSCHFQNCLLNLCSSFPSGFGKF